VKAKGEEVEEKPAGVCLRVFVDSIKDKVQDGFGDEIFEDFDDEFVYLGFLVMETVAHERDQEMPDFLLMLDIFELLEASFLDCIELAVVWKVEIDELELEHFLH
jgi:hypothetical protein